MCWWSRAIVVFEAKKLPYIFCSGRGLPLTKSTKHTCRSTHTETIGHSAHTDRRQERKLPRQ